MPPATTHGERIRMLFRDAAKAVVVAPFMKVDALHSLLQDVPRDAHLRCVTRWLPREVAAGVSDPEVFDVLHERGNASLSLVDRLHAKLYIADGKCLAGSANVTLAGFGETQTSGNIEVLLETTTGNPEIAGILDDIDREAIEATDAMALAVRRLADSLPSPADVAPDAGEFIWYPLSRNPERAFRMYESPPGGFVTTADRRLIADVADCNLLPGLNEAGFRQAVRDRLAEIPMSTVVLGGTQDFLLTRGDAGEFIESMVTDEYSSTDVWAAFVRWMAHFFGDRLTIQEVSELALRRAQNVT